MMVMYIEFYNNCGTLVRCPADSNFVPRVGEILAIDGYTGLRVKNVYYNYDHSTIRVICDY